MTDEEVRQQEAREKIAEWLCVSETRLKWREIDSACTIVGPEVVRERWRQKADALLALKDAEGKPILCVRRCLAI